MSYIQSQRGKFDSHIEVDGKFYFNASIMKQCFEEHLTSTKRLRKVTGLLKYLISPSDNVQNVDNIVLLSDTVIVKINGALRIAVIKEIIRGKSKLKRATPDKTKKDKKGKNETSCSWSVVSAIIGLCNCY